MSIILDIGSGLSRNNSPQRPVVIGPERINEIMHLQDDCWLLVTDVDDTLIGDDEAYREFERALTACPAAKVALNSSRPVASVQNTLASLEPPLAPVAIIGAMGTEILHRGRFVSEWTDRFGDWSRRPIDQVMSALGFQPHDAEYQTRFKASYVVPGGESEKKARKAISSLAQTVRIVTSGASDFDVLPPNADKGEATLFLTAMLGASPTRLIVAGDSANDLAMFDKSERGIVVGNARDELRRAVNPNGVYFASEARAHGLLEGLRHYGVPIQTEGVIR